MSIPTDKLDDSIDKIQNTVESMTGRRNVREVVAIVLGLFEPAEIERAASAMGNLCSDELGKKIQVVTGNAKPLKNFLILEKKTDRAVDIVRAEDAIVALQFASDRHGIRRGAIQAVLEANCVSSRSKLAWDKVYPGSHLSQTKLD